MTELDKKSIHYTFPVSTDSFDYVGVLISLCLFLFAAETKEFFLDWLKKLEQRSHKCVEVRGEYVNTFFNPVAFCFLYKTKDLSAPPPPLYPE
jgi:hypothetical protein